MSFFHEITSEGRPFQRRTIYLLAKYLELPLLGYSYKLLRGSWKWLGQKAWVKKIITHLISRPFALYGDTARPVPYDELLAHVDELDCRIAVGSCRCRGMHDACSHPLMTDIVIRTGTDAWLKAFPDDYKEIDKATAVEIISECHELGMFHMLFYHCPGTGLAEYVICNCCTCGCVPYILNRELGQYGFPFFRGQWVASTKADACVACGKCVEICPFDAREISGKMAVTTDCFGCGLCFYECPENAIELVGDHRTHDDHPGNKILKSHD